jgi:formylglycine-generating enzyme required for sulfatase activity
MMQKRLQIGANDRGRDMAQNYPLNKRRGGGAWQWMLIGFVPGFLCAAVIAIVAVASGALNSFGIGQQQVIEVTREIQVGIVVTSTPDPLVSPEVIVVTATDAPTTEPNEGAVILPTETPQTQAELASSPEATAEAQSNVQSSTQATNTVASASGLVIPASLDTVKSQMVTIAGSSFLMGTTPNEIFEAAQQCVNRDGGACDPAFGEDSTPRVPVTLDTFAMETTEVTFSQYVVFLNYLKSQGLSHTSGCGGFLCIQTANERADVAVIAYDAATYSIPTRLQNLQNQPVYGVTWYGANAYCQALGRRLPSEAEWEYAARAGGQDIPYPWGINFASTFANWRIPAIQAEGQGPVPVTSMLEGRNALLLYHMAGNVSEWTNDWYDEFYYQTLSAQAAASDDGSVHNPLGPAGGTQRSIRGGSYNDLPFFARTYHRQAEFPLPETNTSDFQLWVGFRCVKSGEADNATSSGTTTGGNPLQTIPTGGTPDANAQPTAPSSEEESEAEGGTPRG